MTELPETAKTVLWLGETAGFWIQTGAFLLSAIGAVAVIYYNNLAARKRATIDLVMHQKSDNRFMEARKKIKLLMGNENECCAKYFKDHNSDEYKAILEVLNSYEFVASGIRETAFDESIYKRMQYSIVTSDWDSLHGFVAEIRNKNNAQTLYKEFEWLAMRWKDKPLKVKN